MSCSAWMVATIECMVRSRARDSCAISAPSPTTTRSVVGLGVEQVVLDRDDRARRRSAAPGGVRRPAGRPPWPGRTPRPRGPASRSAASRGARRAARSGRCSAGASPSAARSSRPKTSPSWAALRVAIRLAAWKTIASRSTRPPSWPSRARPWPSRASACGVLRRLLELVVDAVDERLLVRDLLLGDGVVGRGGAGADLVNGQSYGSWMRVRTIERVLWGWFGQVHNDTPRPATPVPRFRRSGTARRLAVPRWDDVRASYPGPTRHTRRARCTRGNTA